MSVRPLLTLVLTAFTALTLTAAAPAYACGKDCDCAKKAKKATTTKPDAKPEAKPEAGDKKADLAAPAPAVAAGDEKGCDCEKGGKGCTCKKGTCKCANCGQAKFAAGEEKKKCECTKDPKECACKGKCKCHEKTGTRA